MGKFDRDKSLIHIQKSCCSNINSDSFDMLPLIAYEWGNYTTITGRVNEMYPNNHIGLAQNT